MHGLRPRSCWGFLRASETISAMCSSECFKGMETDNDRSITVREFAMVLIRQGVGERGDDGVSAGCGK